MPLHHAATHERATNVQLLIAAGASVNAEDKVIVLHIQGHRC